MHSLHICNTFFEKELEAPSPRSLVEWLRYSPISAQLQFLPLLYANPHDTILVSDLPPSPEARLQQLEMPCLAGKLVTWGPSLAIAEWAKKRKITYEIPPWSTVREVNSKLFSFSQSPRLPFATLLSSEAEVASWAASVPGPKVLKTAYGTAGNGHFHIEKKKHLPARLSAQFLKGDALLGEPWVERLLDFSTQWKIDGTSIEYLGVTLLENAPNGTYLASSVGKGMTPPEWALEEHLSIAQPLLKKLSNLGFFGNVGIDAFLYRWEGREHLHPIAEINGRKTMGWVALQILKKNPPRDPLRISFARAREGLLPTCLEGSRKKIFFHRNFLFL